MAAARFLGTVRAEVLGTTLVPERGVRTLIRAGVDETTAMKVSGYKARSMLLHYNIVTERVTGDALLRADAYLSTLPTRVEDEEGQLRDIRESGGGKERTRPGGMAPQVGFEPGKTLLRLTTPTHSIQATTRLSRSRLRTA